MKLGANKSLHCTDYEMVAYLTEIFSVAFNPGASPQNSSNDITASYDVTEEMTRITS